MSRYSSNIDVKSPHYKKMDESYHEEAERYIDNVLIRPAGFTPSEVTTYGVPWIVKQIAVLYAMQHYAEDSIANDSEFWQMQADNKKYERMQLEKRFDPGVILSGESNATSDSGGMSGRFRRV